MTNAEMLALVETAIEKRLNGDAYEEYTEAGNRFKGATLKQLMDIRDDLKAKVEAEGGGTGVGIHQLAEPFPE